MTLQMQVYHHAELPEGDWLLYYGGVTILLFYLFTIACTLTQYITELNIDGKIDYILYQ